jgi:hypothetical protein
LSSLRYALPCHSSHHRAPLRNATHRLVYDIEFNTPLRASPLRAASLCVALQCNDFLYPFPSRRVSTHCNAAPHGSPQFHATIFIPLSIFHRPAPQHYAPLLLAVYCNSTQRFPLSISLAPPHVASRPVATQLHALRRFATLSFIPLPTPRCAARCIALPRVGPLRTAVQRNASIFVYPFSTAPLRPATPCYSTHHDAAQRIVLQNNPPIEKG